MRFARADRKQKAAVAQSVERRIGSAEVTGPIPVSSSSEKWRKALVYKVIRYFWCISERGRVRSTKLLLLAVLALIVKRCNRRNIRMSHLIPNKIVIELLIFANLLLY